MGKRHAHGFRIGRAVQIDVAPEGIDLPHPVVTRLAAAEPENTGQDPVAPRKLRVQLRIPDLARPAPAAQYGTRRQAVANARTHLMATARRTTGTVAFTHAIQGGGYGQTDPQDRKST